MYNLLRHIIIPQCIFCGHPFTAFCVFCLARCSLIEKPICIECRNYSHHGITHKNCLKNKSPLILYSPFSYDYLIAECIRRSKYFRKEFASLIELSKFGVFLTKEEIFVSEDFIIIPVPLSKKRFKQRGFNQAEIIAQELANKLKIKVHNSCVKRIKETEAQYKQDKIERRINLLNAFKVYDDVVGKKILVVDDIFTTGATMLELAKTLYNAGASEVRCFALSRVL